MVTVTISRAAPHYLVADGAPAAVRRTRAGDAWEAKLTGRAHDFDDLTPVGSPERQPVVLGMPALSRPV
jgi:tRNA-2-methylthio-N6-dimethylallyladenosine synthase